ncbi:hypothetical protein MCERHM31_00811 [Methylophilaceae bacterium]
MKKKTPEYGTPDLENPELTEEFFKNARPLYELFPHMKPNEKKDTKSKEPIHRHLQVA